MSSTYVPDNISTGAWDFQNDGLVGQETITIGNLQLKNTTFVESINGSGYSTTINDVR